MRMRHLKMETPLPVVIFPDLVIVGFAVTRNVNCPFPLSVSVLNTLIHLTVLLTK